MKSKKFLLFLPESTVNEATIFYINIIRSALEKLNYEVIQSKNPIHLFKYSNIFVMSAKWFLVAKAANPKAKVITWFQGLGSEEVMMNGGSKSDKLLWVFAEYCALKSSWLNIYVSKSMRKHFSDKYNMKNESFFIMPCFNKELVKESFDYLKKYNNPTFVYAGSLDEWQCIDQTLELYSKIEMSIPNASLTILTKDIDYAVNLLKNYNISNAHIRFVPLEELNDELKLFKYGFLIRKNHIVNNISTPTKMSSYLANGVIPIYSNVIEDFNENLSSKNFISLDYADSISSWSEHVINFEKSFDENNNIFKQDVFDLFSDYYSRVKYIELLSNKIMYLL